MNYNVKKVIESKYTILEQISCSNYSEVYKACHRQLNIVVTLKLYKDNYVSELVKIMKVIEHKYIPELLEFFKVGDRCIIVMEYIEGIDLMQYIKDSSVLNRNTAVKYILQVCDVVEYLHELNPPIIHCDIKPNNLILTNKDNIFLIDFNLSLFYKRGVCTKGRTDGYSPPEFYSDNEFKRIQDKLNVTAKAYTDFSTVPLNYEKYKPITKSADIFSIGATLYYFLTGQQHRYNNTDYMSIDSDLVKIITKATELDPRKRYHSIQEMKNDFLNTEYDYDIVLSFAGEDRDYVKEVANILKNKSIRVFYDMYEQANLWGKDLYLHLDDIYQNKARFCVVFISKHYKIKLWTNHEMRSAFARAFKSKTEYVLPARFDDTEIPGIRETTGYVDLRNMTPNELSKLIIEKVAEQKTSH